MTARFPDFAAAGKEGPLAGIAAGELISLRGGGAHRPLREFAEAAETMARRRVDLLEVAGELGVRLSAAGTHPFARWQDQQVIDTPHYHLVEETLRYVAWRNNTFGIHVHTGIRGADRAVAVTSALRNVLPELLARVRRPRPGSRVATPICTRPGPQIFTRFFPRCGIPDALADWGELRGVRALPDRHPVDPRAHGDLVERAPAPGLPDRRDADLRRPARIRRGGGDRRR